MYTLLYKSYASKGHNILKQVPVINPQNIVTMRDNNKKNIDAKKPVREGHLFRRWKEPSKNKMGNDISSEIKIADSGGKLEGGKDKRGHLSEE